MPDWLTELVKLAGAATPGPWRYGGMIGDPGSPLRHFIEDAEGRPFAFSEEFAADYAGLDRPFLYIAACTPERILALCAVVAAADADHRTEDGDEPHAEGCCAVCDALARLESLS